MRNGLLINYELCTGCHTCEVACKIEHGIPAGKWGIHILDDGLWPINQKKNEWNWNHIPVPTNLCDLCADRVSKKREPTCVHHCLAQVMTFGPVDELAKALAENPRQMLFVPDAEKATQLLEDAREAGVEDCVK